MVAGKYDPSKLAEVQSIITATSVSAFLLIVKILTCLLVHSVSCVNKLYTNWSPSALSLCVNKLTVCIPSLFRVEQKQEL